MKKISMAAFAVAVIMLAGCLPSMAQGGSLRVTFTTPFSFYVGGAKLPAGTYTISPQPDDPSVLIVQNASGSHIVMVEGQPSTKNSPGHPKLLFNRYGTGEFLEGVEAESGNSVTLNVGVAEKMAARKETPQAHSMEGSITQ